MKEPSKERQKIIVRNTLFKAGETPIAQEKRKAKLIKDAEKLGLRLVEC